MKTEKEIIEKIQILTRISLRPDFYGLWKTSQAKSEIKILKWVLD